MSEPDILEHRHKRFAQKDVTTDWHSGVDLLIKLAALLSSLISGLLYVFSLSFYGTLGVSPQEVGFSFTELLVRATLAAAVLSLAIVLLVPVSLVSLGLVWLQLRAGGMPRPSARAKEVLSAFVFPSVGALVIGGWSEEPYLALATLAGLLILEYMWRKRPSLKAVRALFLVLCAFTVTAFAAADQGARSAQDLGADWGDSLLVIAVQGTTYPIVRANFAEEFEPPDWDRRQALLRLGSEGGVTVLYNPSTSVVYRVASDNVELLGVPH